MVYSVTLSHDESRLRQLKDEWDALQEKSYAEGIYTTWVWMSTWWKHYQHLGDLWLLEARTEDSRLIGLAPLMLVTHQPMPGVSWQQLQFIGKPFYCEHLDFIIENGCESEVIPAFFETLKQHSQQWDVLSLNRIMPDSPSLPVLEQLGIEWQELEEHIAPYIVLDKDWDTYFESLSKTKRKQQRRAMRKLSDDYADQWQFDYVTNPAELDATVEAMIALHQKKWEGRDEAGAFADPRNITFAHDITKAFLEKGWLRLYRLRVQGKPMAIFYAYRFRDRLYHYAGGVNYEYADLDPGHLLDEMVIHDCIESGAKEVDFLWGTEPYKYSWGAVDRIDRSLLWLASAKARRGQQVTELTRNMWHSAKTLLPTGFKKRLTGQIQKLKSQD